MFLREDEDEQPDDCASVSSHEWQSRGPEETKRLIKWFRELDMQEVMRIGCEQIDYQKIKNMKFSDLMNDSFKVDCIDLLRKQYLEFDGPVEHTRKRQHV